jgi:hypothetical protein
MKILAPTDKIFVGKNGGSAFSLFLLTFPYKMHGFFTEEWQSRVEQNPWIFYRIVVMWLNIYATVTANSAHQTKRYAFDLHHRAALKFVLMG